MTQETKATLLKGIVRLILFAIVAFILYTSTGCARKTFTIIMKNPESVEHEIELEPLEGNVCE